MIDYGAFGKTAILSSNDVSNCADKGVHDLFGINTGLPVDQTQVLSILAEQIFL